MACPDSLRSGLHNTNGGRAAGLACPREQGHQGIVLSSPRTAAPPDAMWSARDRATGPDVERPNSRATVGPWERPAAWRRGPRCGSRLMTWNPSPPFLPGVTPAPPPEPGMNLMDSPAARSASPSRCAS